MTPTLLLILLGFFAVCAFGCFLGWDMGEQARDQDYVGQGPRAQRDRAPTPVRHRHSPVAEGGGVAGPPHAPRARREGSPVTTPDILLMAVALIPCAIAAWLWVKEALS